LETNDCPLCDQACADLRALALHLLEFHAVRGIKNNQLCLTYEGAGFDGWPAMYCWCANWDASETMPGLAEKFAIHLSSRGGLAAHLLEVTIEDYYELPF
jgi:hypothetical protein